MDPLNAFMSVAFTIFAHILAFWRQSSPTDSDSHSAEAKVEDVVRKTGFTYKPIIDVAHFKFATIFTMRFLVDFLYNCIWYKKGVPFPDYVLIATAACCSMDYTDYLDLEYALNSRGSRIICLARNGVYFVYFSDIREDFFRMRFVLML